MTLALFRGCNGEQRAALLPVAPSPYPVRMHRGARSLASAILAVFLLSNTACFAYLEPLGSSGGAPAGADVRLALTDSGTVVLRTMLGGSAESIVGSLVADSSRAYVVRASGVSYRTGSDVSWRGETLSIDKSLVSSIGVRQFSLGRSVVVAGATAAVLIGIRQVFVGVGRGSTTITGNPRPGGQ